MTQSRKAAPTTTVVQLPLFATLAIYTRVTTEQGNQAEPAQVETLRNYASTLGYGNEQVIVFCDAAAKAATPLLERQGYTALVTAIRENVVSVILLHVGERIFEGATELQVNAFIYLCMEKAVFIVTSQTIYDMQDLSHVALFRKHFAPTCAGLEEAVKVRA